MNKKHMKYWLILLSASIVSIFTGCENGLDIFSNSDIELIQLTYIVSDRDQDWSPNGEEIIFVRKTGIEDNLWIVDVKTRKVRKMQILGTEPAWHPFRKNTFAYQQNGKIFIKGVYLKQLTNSNYVDRQPAWSPSGSKIAFTRSMDVETIWSVNSDGSDQIQLTTSSDGYCSSPAFNYDNSKIVYIRSNKLESEINEIWIMDSDGSNKHKLFAPGDTKQTISNWAWNQNGKIIFTRSYPKGVKPSTASDLWIMNSDGSGLKSILESFTFSYNNPVWNKQGDKIALNMNIFNKEKARTGSDIYFFSYR